MQIDQTHPDLILAEEMAKFYADPLGFVMFAFPWGKPGTPIAEFSGPEPWQRDLLIEFGKEIAERGFNGRDPVKPIKHAIASGHGIGKTTMVAWLILFMMSTRPMCRGIVTAMTTAQLQTRTWSELAKWHRMSITEHWFRLTSGIGSLSFAHNLFKENWRCDGQTSTKENSEAFAGMHNRASTTFFIFDEASGIPEEIYKVRDGALSDGEPIVFDFGNPTRNSGRFFENMKGRFRDQYVRKHINSLDVAIANHAYMREQIIDVYGEDSDEARIRVYGEFPHKSASQLIPNSSYEDNVERDVIVVPHDPLIMGVDVARFGDDRSVIWLRRGRDAETHNNWDRQIMAKADTLEVAGRVAEIAREFNPNIINVDGGGVGGGVVDTLRGWGFEVNEINFGAKATDRGYFNMRAQMWAKMRDALAAGVRLPNMQDLKTDLTSIEYTWSPKNDLVLERKEDMKKRGLKSPDLADALALTWAVPYAPLHRPSWDGEAQHARDYNPF